MQKHKSTIKRILAYIGHYKWGVLASLVLADPDLALVGFGRLDSQRYRELLPRYLHLLRVQHLERRHA